MEEIAINRARENFSEIMENTCFSQKVYLITRHGREMGVLIPTKIWQDYEKIKKRVSFVD